MDRSVSHSAPMVDQMGSRPAAGLLAALACSQALSLYMQKRAAMELDGFPYIPALTQPICTSTCFGLLGAVSFGIRRHLGRASRECETAENSSSRGSINRDSSSLAAAESDVAWTVPLLREHESAPLLRPSPAPNALASGSAQGSPPLRIFSLAGAPVDLQGYMCSVTATGAFVMIGGLLSLGNFLTFAGMRGDLVSGALAVLLQQAVLPCTVGFSVLVLRRRYELHEAVGVGVVLAGIALVSLTKVLAAHATAAATVAVLLVLAAAVPNALALVLMELLLRRMAVDVWWLWAWVNVYEVVFAVPIIFAQMAIEHVDDYAAALHQGYVQFFAGAAVAWFAGFIASVVANKLITYLVIQRGGATLNWLALAAAIPLADILFSISPATRAQDAAWMWAVDVAALAVVVCGLAVYHGAGMRWAGCWVRKAVM